MVITLSGFSYVSTAERPVAGQGEREEEEEEGSPSKSPRALVTGRGWGWGVSSLLPPNLASLRRWEMGVGDGGDLLLREGQTRTVQHPPGEVPSFVLLTLPRPPSVLPGVGTASCWDA